VPGFNHLCCCIWLAHDDLLARLASEFGLCTVGVALFYCYEFIRIYPFYSPLKRFESNWGYCSIIGTYLIVRID